MKSRRLLSSLIMGMASAILVVGFSPPRTPVAAAASPPRIVAYLSQFWNPGINLTQISSGIWEVLVPTSATDMTLLPYESTTTDMATMVSALHAAGKPIEVSVYAPWGQNAYNAVFTDSALRDSLFQQIVYYIDQYGFDGVNFDWECDNDPNLSPQDVTNFYAQLFSILNPKGKTISVTENYGKVVMTPAAANYLDYVGLMVYDVESPATWYGSVNCATTDLTRWASAGFPKSKLILGISFAARYSTGGGWFSYKYVVDKYNPSPLDNQAGNLAYNGITLVAQKAQLVLNNGFGGVFSYGTSLDELNDPRSLLQQIYSVFGGVSNSKTTSSSSQVSLTMSVLGQGTTSPRQGTTPFPAGTQVSLSATPAIGYVFSNWTGGASGTSNPLTLTVSSNTSLQAVFLPSTTSSPPPSNPYSLKVTTLGQGTTNLAPGTYSIPANQSITMHATPSAGWKFRSWTWPGNDPAYSGWPDNPTTWTMVESITITAIFDPVTQPTPTPTPTPVPATVSPINLPPIWNQANDQVISINHLARFKVSATDPNGDKLIYSASPLPPGATFDQSSGQFGWTPRHSQIGKYSVTFSCSDGTTVIKKVVIITVK